MCGWGGEIEEPGNKIICYTGQLIQVHYTIQANVTLGDLTA